MRCDECNNEYRKIKTCCKCKKHLCPVCVKFYNNKYYCSDCFASLRDSALKRVWNYNVNDILNMDIKDILDEEVTR